MPRTTTSGDRAVMSDPIHNFLNKRPAALARIEQEGLSIADYGERLKLSYRDFAIVCHQRSGSHLLATALNSHPDIDCQGELLQLIKTPAKSYAPVAAKTSAKLRGAIIMYNQLRIAAELGLMPGKIIHLLRNPAETARSIVLNAASNAIQGDHSPHSLRAKPAFRSADLVADPDEILRYEDEVRTRQDEQLRSLPTPRLDIWYDDICGGRDVESLEASAAERILNFLGAEPVVALTTPLAKAAYR